MTNRLNHDQKIISSLNTLLKVDRQNDFPQQTIAQLKTRLADSIKGKKTLWQRFYNLSITRKQLIALIASEFISILGIGIVARYLITINLYTLLLEQAKSEVAVTDINYNIKLNQMGFGFRGQSDNPAIIKAVNLHNSGQTLNPDVKAEIKKTLQNETRARKIEYATLVGKDFKIIVNANTNREGEIFNPDNLVSDVFNNHQQIKASKIVKWSELSKELPPLPIGFNRQDALIRYTVTPVKDPNTRAVIGALVSGDIVNGKDQIVSSTLKAMGGGYSAIYLRKPTGEFSLVTALDKDQSRIELPPESKSLLINAAAAEGKAVTTRMRIGQRSYTVAFKAVPDKIIEVGDNLIQIFDEQSAAILVRGTPETGINQLLKNSLWTELATIVVAWIIISIWAIILRRSIIKPIQELEETANKFATGDRTARSEIFATDEVGQLALTFNDMADSINEQIIRQENEAKLAQTVNQITGRFRGSLNTVYILNSAVNSTREAIKADRVIVYRFDENWYGTIIAESVDDDLPLALGSQIADPCFAKSYVNKYQKGLVQSCEDIYTAGLTPCHINQLEQFAIKANLVVPILINNKLYGLLIAHQCSGPRKWQDIEINLLKQVAIPIGYTLEQTSLLEQLDTQRSRAEVATSEQYQKNEVLQQQILNLLRDIEGISRGDLTVRSAMTFGELGTVAESFNSIVENLRAMVTKIKVSANQVNTEIAHNAADVQQLTNKTLQQADSISLTFASVNNMKLSMGEVAENAKQAAQVAHNASLTAENSEAAIDITVQNILKLRSTIGDTAKKVKLLGESSQQISQIVSLISQISTQTNLLAINAGIEATKVGDENEGFASIAKEIGDLAVCCTDATQDIKRIIERIQLETSEVVKAMEQGTTQVVEGSRMVGDVKIAVSEILNVSHQIDELAQSVSQMTLSQLETSQGVSKLMQEICQVSDLTSTSSRLVAQSLEQTVEISQELQKTVEAFKVI